MGHDVAMPLGGENQRRMWIFVYLAATVATFFVVGVDMIQFQAAKAAPRAEAKSDIRPKPVLLARNGRTIPAPASTIYAFDLAWNHYADGLSVDIFSSKDSVPFCFESNDLSVSTDGTGLVGDRESKYIKTLNAAAKFPEKGKFAKVTPMTMREALDYAIGKKMTHLNFNLNLTGKENDSFLASIIQLIMTSYNTGVEVTLTSSDVNALEIIERSVPAVITGAVSDSVSINNSTRKVWEGKWDFAVIEYSALSKSVVKSCREANKLVFVLKLPDEAEAVEKVLRLGADGVITKYIAVVQRVWYRLSLEGVLPFSGF